ncbi:MAG: hypothetical protein Q7K26_02755 [bacterium]|nr:hypothetical protein [bacterium]
MSSKISSIIFIGYLFLILSILFWLITLFNPFFFPLHEINLWFSSLWWPIPTAIGYLFPIISFVIGMYERKQNSLHARILIVLSIVNFLLPVVLFGWILTHIPL